MTTQLHDTGEEWIIDTAFVNDPGTTSVDVGLYNDSTDGLSDSSDVPSITSEPSGGAYARQTASIENDFSANDTGNWEAIIADQSFDTSDSSQSVDSYFVVVNFDSDDAGDGGTASDHLLFTGSLDQTYDLGSVDSFTLSGSGISIN